MSTKKPKKEDKKNNESHEENENIVDDTSVVQENVDTEFENKIKQLEDSEKELIEKVKSLEKENQELKDASLRSIAEFDNFRKRTVKEKSDIRVDEKIKVISEILPALDTFEKALEFECSDDEFKKGIEMIRNQLFSAITKLGVEEIDSIDKPFDPQFHNAISQITDEKYDSNIVCQVCQKGYKIGDKVLRHAMVVVANP